MRCHTSTPAAIAYKKEMQEKKSKKSGKDSTGKTKAIASGKKAGGNG